MLLLLTIAILFVGELTTEVKADVLFVVRILTTSSKHPFIVSLCSLEAAIVCVQEERDVLFFGRFKALCLSSVLYIQPVHYQKIDNCEYI